MSEILDALRRRGEEESPARSTGVRIPAGLGLGRRSTPATRPRRAWLPWAVGTLLVIAAIWVVVRLVIDPRESAPQVAEVPAATPGPSVPARARPPDDTPVVLDAPSTETETAEPSPPVPALRGPALRGPLPGPPAEVATPTPVDHFELALRYQRLGEFEQASTHYLTLLEDEPFHVEARNNLGLLYHGQGMTENAIDEYRRALVVDPRYAKARTNLAAALLKAGRLAEARTELTSALDIDPRDVGLLVNLALVERAEGRPERAIELLIRAVGEGPSHPFAHYNLGVLYDERGEGGLAHDHYVAFLRHAAPSDGALLADVRHRVGRLGRTRDDVEP